ncbi:RtcB family protein [Phytomonospora endophytica]|uniref:3'-phosphate/5'-hydroxy nucleic acid ligase n=1 Tax=Phytomonospora endophytica TaxID=714109 RepID=A0A841FSY0_9ACTN|nr:RtcB family protein [Phytomonospora endophytica]MBB6039395.1 tRNA-splicing ligase RtcB [Phytomonospora endophytica]GIG70122.1 RNA-splicing ligase RtcB [Phytomonospora endophytica]
MPYQELPGKTAPIRLWADPESVEEQALGQLSNIAALPWLHGLAVMPDVHFGMGATVGSVIAMRGAVSPAAVGVDIGCGMTAQLTSLTAEDLPDDLGKLRGAIEAAIPVGFNMHKRSVDVDHLKTGMRGWFEFWNDFEDLAKPIARRKKGRAMQQLGTLGGGNHFIEVCLSTDGRVWLMLHSGSRNVGKELAEFHISRAKDLPHNQDLPDPNLAVFLDGAPTMDEYRRDLFWAQDYAKRNRAVMMALLREVVRKAFKKVTFEPEISCHHNYVAAEVHDGQQVLVTRKGAIRAGDGDLGIIPGSMGASSFIVRGLGNAASFESASHGAGRRMSRTKARKLFGVEDLETQTAGVECRKDAGVVDEIPAAYKDIDVVMEQQKDLVEVVARLKQVVCVKG